MSIIKFKVISFLIVLLSFNFNSISRNSSILDNFDYRIVSTCLDEMCGFDGIVEPMLACKSSGLNLSSPNFFEECIKLGTKNCIGTVSQVILTDLDDLKSICHPAYPYVSHNSLTSFINRAKLSKGIFYLMQLYHETIYLYIFNTQTNVVLSYQVPSTPENLARFKLDFNLLSYFTDIYAVNKVDNIVVTEIATTYYSTFRDKVAQLRVILETQRGDVYTAVLERLATGYRLILSQLGHEAYVENALKYLIENRAEINLALINKDFKVKNYKIKDSIEFQKEYYLNLYKLHVLIFKEMLDTPEDYFGNPDLVLAFKYLVEQKTTNATGAALLGCAAALIQDQRRYRNILNQLDVTNFSQEIYELYMASDYIDSVISHITSDDEVKQYMSTVLSLSEYSLYLASKTQSKNAAYLNYAGLPVVGMLVKYYSGPFAVPRIVFSAVILFSFMTGLILFNKYITKIRIERKQTMEYIEDITKELGAANKLISVVKPEYIIAIFLFIIISLIWLILRSFNKKL